MPTRPHIPPDDDPRFDQWVRDIGPLMELDLPTIRVGSSVPTAVVLIAAIIGLSAALGFGLAMVLDAVPVLTACLLIGGGTVLAVGALAYLVWRAV